MREIYTAPNEEAGLPALGRFEEKWGNKYYMQLRAGEVIGRVYLRFSNILLRSGGLFILIIPLRISIGV